MGAVDFEEALAEKKDIIWLKFKSVWKLPKKPSGQIKRLLTFADFLIIVVEVKKIF